MPLPNISHLSTCPNPPRMGAVLVPKQKPLACLVIQTRLTDSFVPSHVLRPGKLGRGRCGSACPPTAPDLSRHTAGRETHRIRGNDRTSPVGLDGGKANGSEEEGKCASLQAPMTTSSQTSRNTAKTVASNPSYALTGKKAKRCDDSPQCGQHHGLIALL